MRLFQRLQQVFCAHHRLASYQQWKAEALRTGDLRVWCTQCGWKGPMRADDRATPMQIAMLRQTHNASR